MLHTSSDHLPIWAWGSVRTNILCLQAAKFAWQPLSWASSCWSSWSTQMSAPTCRIDTWHALRTHASAALSDSETSIRWAAGACIDTVGSSVTSVSSITANVHGHTVGSCIPSVSSITVSVTVTLLEVAYHLSVPSLRMFTVTPLDVAYHLSVPSLWVFTVTLLEVAYHLSVPSALVFTVTLLEVAKHVSVLSAWVFTVTLLEVA